MNRFIAGFPVLTLLLVFCGCEKVPTGLEPEKIVCPTSEAVLGLPGQMIPKACRIEVLSKTIPGCLGGEGVQHPVAGLKITAVPVDPACGLTVAVPHKVTDSGGNAEFDVQLGNQFGDQYLDVVADDYPEVRKRLRFVSGMSIENGRQEVAAGDVLDQPIRVRLAGADGVPLVDESVFFTLARQPGKDAKISKSLVKTDTNGMAEVNLKTEADLTGKYELRAEVSNPKKGLFTRPVFIDAMAMSISGIVIGVLGGLAIFIFGMTLMSDGLNQIAGNKMKAALGFVTRNRISGILAGTVVTGLIQSSSATTVMTVGFVNAGLLSLQQAIGVIFGANIGTTVTGQMVSFKLEWLAQPAIILGVLLLLVCQKTLIQGIARTTLGFGLLFFGMTLMSNELRSVSDFPSFVKFFQTFDCSPLQSGGEMPLKAVLGAIGIGTLMTMVVQSSSATIGLAIALANSGLLNIWTAIPIVLGDNIGTTITAILASLSANRTAKQAAAAHSMFNILGTVVMVFLFYVPVHGIPCFFFLVNDVTAGNVFMGENVGRHVAMAHSLFNVTNVIVMTPFIGGLAWLCEHLIPLKKEERVVRLEAHLLRTPALAMICVANALADMTEKAWKASLEALRGYKRGKPVPVDGIKKVEDEVDAMQGEIMNYLVKLTRSELTEEQAQAVPILMHCVNDAERISDLAYLIARRAAAQAEAGGGGFTDHALEDLQAIIGKANQVADMTLEGLRGSATGSTKAVMLLIKDIKTMSRESVKGHVNRIQTGKCAPERGMVYVDVLAAIENIVRHLENIIERVEQMTQTV